ncbi:hypothetical protein COU37_05195 [Candidatus Micrarchaeota archaeon CG10_big_fil_rev_8_21_14_0_10_45_29]|nr:MAG: hypothetical protein COU37_05195 [Candidatus Micrarchaeota archaeon CG10_big_fil_rev_8_21_14_0_10_45_29]
MKIFGILAVLAVAASLLAAATPYSVLAGLQNKGAWDGEDVNSLDMQLLREYILKEFEPSALPEAMRPIIGAQTSNIYLEDEFAVCLRTTTVRFEEVYASECKNAKVDILIKKSSLQKIATKIMQTKGDVDVTQEIMDEYYAGGAKIEARGSIDKAKYGALDFFAKAYISITKFFGGLFG